MEGKNRGKGNSTIVSLIMTRAMMLNGDVNDAGDAFDGNIQYKTKKRDPFRLTEKFLLSS